MKKKEMAIIAALTEDLRANPEKHCAFGGAKACFNGGRASPGIFKKVPSGARTREREGLSLRNGTVRKDICRIENGRAAPYRQTVRYAFTQPWRH